MNASGEWDMNSAYLLLCRVGMTVKFARALHRDSVPIPRDFCSNNSVSVEELSADSCPRGDSVFLNKHCPRSEACRENRDL